MTNNTTPLPPLSMYRITTKLFTHMERSITLSFGAEGKRLLEKGLERFGFKEAQAIAEQATAEGEDHVLDNYIPDSYDSIDKYEGLTIYSLMAKLFAQVTKAVVDVYGEKGKDAIREGVRTFGEERGNGIAHRAAHMGEKNTIDNYLSNYDMGRSELFEFENIFKENVIEQTFTKCPFGEQWAKDGMHEYGILYCEMIDPAVAKGFNPKFEVEHEEYVLKEGRCTFKFKLDEK
ncbi:hypothetical protein J2S74_004230 [Evansella vedderi]|uniref:L-2-amino-thiazoline-4-carboxylic acid hydrolase n=1 Tax=Evansella vedderi TaxID=38282 RepID=A0ABU0A282_9BACI|nr:L-2-amino-thiazoline-4-carboxylic acid hydrolase [Evansella vedderi]MDQ0256808.1 hypothetical protein [Evansella vedderi]